MHGLETIIHWSNLILFQVANFDDEVYIFLKPIMIM